MPALANVVAGRGPAFESLQGRNPRWEFREGRSDGVGERDRAPWWAAAASESGDPGSDAACAVSFGARLAVAGREQVAARSSFAMS